MENANLVALRNAIATNTLTAGQQTDLLQALDAILPDFPTPDEISRVTDESLARQWIAALYAVQQGGGGPMPPNIIQHDLLWQVGAPAAGNVVGTWAELAPILQAQKGQKRVVIDASAAAPHITSGVFDGITDVVFLTGGSTPLVTGLFVDDGAVFTNTRKLTFSGIALVTLGSTPWIDLPSGQDLVLQFLRGFLSAGSATPPIRIADTSALFVEASNATVIAPGAVTLVGTGSSASFSITGFSRLNPEAVLGGIGSVSITTDGSSEQQVSTVQGVPSVQLFVQGAAILERPLVLATDQTLVGIAPMTDVAGMQQTFTPNTSQVLIRIVASVTATGAFTGRMAARVAFAGAQFGTLSPGASSATNTGGGFATIVYEATLAGLTPGIPNSVTVAAQWANDNADTLQCLPLSDPAHYEMAITISDYEG